MVTFQSLQCQWHIQQATWRWLWSSKNGVKLEDRQALLKLFREVIYAKTYSDFQERDKELEDDELSKKYPHFVEHLAKAYGRRIETWALFYRRENNLPTRGSETNNYC